MTVIWPRLRACFRTPSHHKSGRQECDSVSRPVSPLRAFRPSLRLSRHALPPFSSPPSSFLTALRPSTVQTLLLLVSSSFSPLFYLLPPFPSFITTLSPPSPILPFPEFIHPPILLLWSLPDSSSPSSLVYFSTV